jgi:hypothetical protein
MSVDYSYRREVEIRVNLNPTAPTIRSLITIHKINSPIRPIINWRNAPAYKLAKLISKKLEMYIPLPYTFNTKNSVHLMNDLLEISNDQKKTFASFDITNTYSNDPTNEISQLIELMCNQQNINVELKQVLMKLSQVLIKQSYFQFQGKITCKKRDLLWAPLLLPHFQNCFFNM